MDININLACGSGECCQFPEFTINIDIHVPIAVITEIYALPGGQGDNGYQPPSGDWVDYNGYLVDKCTYANQLATDITESWENLGRLGFILAGLSAGSIASLISSGALASSLTGLLGGAISAAASWPLVVGGFLAFGAVYGSLVYTYFEKLADEISKGDLVCAMYGATDSTTARAALLQQFDDWGLIAAFDNAAIGQWFMDRVLDWLVVQMPYELLEPLFDLTDYVGTLPPGDCTACAQVPPPPPATISQDLLSYWSLEEAGDATRADDHGTEDLLAFNTPANIAGVQGMAADFERSLSQYIRSVPGAVYQTVGNVPWTWVAWVRPESLVDVSETFRTALMVGDNPGNWDTVIALWQNYTAGGNRFKALMGNIDTGGSDLVSIEHSAAVVAEVQYFVAFYHDPVNDLLGLRVNAAAFETVATAGKYPHGVINPRAFIVGANYANGANQFYDGSVDEFGIWDRVLTTDEVDWLWNGGAGRSYAEITA